MNQPAETPTPDACVIDWGITGMTCGHCEKSVTRTVLRWDPQAQVHIDRAHNRVDVDTEQDITPLLALIATEGYPTTAAAA